MICPNCGAPLPDTATICYVCKMKFRGDSNNSFNIRIIAMIAGFLGSVICLVSIFMPYLKASLLGTSTSVSLYDKDGVDGIVFAILAILAMLISFATINKGMGVGLDLLGVLLIVLNICEMITGIKKVNEKNDYGYLVTRGSGFYCMLIGAIIIIIGGALAGIASRTNED